MMILILLTIVLASAGMGVFDIDMELNPFCAMTKSQKKPALLDRWLGRAGCHLLCLEYKSAVGHLLLSGDQSAGEQKWW
jgi:hypothetical protein